MYLYVTEFKNFVVKPDAKWGRSNLGG